MRRRTYEREVVKFKARSCFQVLCFPYVWNIKGEGRRGRTKFHWGGIEGLVEWKKYGTRI